jgi:membrane protein insertase Oxa1/YidC/SpoIIIJ
MPIRQAQGKKKYLLVPFVIAPIILCVLAVYPEVTRGAPVDSSAPIQKDIANVSPQVANASQPVFAALDSFRSSMAEVLDTQLAFAKTKIAATPQPSITDASATKDAAVSNPWGMFWYVLYMLYFYALTILRWIIGNAIVFYTVFVLLVLYILLRVFRWWRRPRY